MSREQTAKKDGEEQRQKSRDMHAKESRRRLLANTQIVSQHGQHGQHGLHFCFVSQPKCSCVCFSPCISDSTSNSKVRRPPIRESPFVLDSIAALAPSLAPPPTRLLSRRRHLIAETTSRRIVQQANFMRVRSFNNLSLGWGSVRRAKRSCVKTGVKLAAQDKQD